jgi:hypothetical protein
VGTVTGVSFDPPQAANKIIARLMIIAMSVWERLGDRIFFFMISSPSPQLTPCGVHGVNCIALSGSVVMVHSYYYSGLAEPVFHTRARRKKKRKGEFSHRGYLGKNFL